MFVVNNQSNYYALDLCKFNLESVTDKFIFREFLELSAKSNLHYVMNEETPLNSVFLKKRINSYN